jgi:hypothetical protein
MRLLTSGSFDRRELSPPALGHLFTHLRTHPVRGPIQAIGPFNIYFVDVADSCDYCAQFSFKVHKVEAVRRRHSGANFYVPAGVSLLYVHTPNQAHVNHTDREALSQATRLQDLIRRSEYALSELFRRIVVHWIFWDEL